MDYLRSLHGNEPTGFQLFATYGVGAAAAALTLAALDFNWKTALLAFLAFDWVGGVVANAAETVREWWRDRPRLKTAFIVVHLIELPLAYWLAGGGVVFYVLGLALAVKLSVFIVGWRRNA